MRENTLSGVLKEGLSLSVIYTYRDLTFMFLTDNVILHVYVNKMNVNCGLEQCVMRCH